MTSRNRDFPEHALSLLGQVMDGMRRDLLARTEGLPACARGLRASQIRLLALTPGDGMRVTDLAERVGMTKQALGEFADTLERRGLMESLRDPADRRVRILRLTDDGREALAATTAVIADVEQEWRARTGPALWDGMREALLAAAAAAAGEDQRADAS